MRREISIVWPRGLGPPDPRSAAIRGRGLQGDRNRTEKERSTSMKSVYSSLVALVVFVVFARLAIADPGTTWENVIFNGPDRFVVLPLFGDMAVFDKETGRVWEQSPSQGTSNWVDAISHCYNLQTNARMGWRLPTVEELASLVDPSQQSPALPAG